jgi:hypothetical protein
MIISKREEIPNGLNRSCSSIEGIIHGEAKVDRETSRPERGKKRAAKRKPAHRIVSRLIMFRPGERL